jgi:hypothetical protein
MPQRIETRDRGSFLVEKTWIKSGEGHVSKLVGGGYCKGGGQPILKASELKNVIPKGEELNEAMEWFANRGKISAKSPRSIVIAPDSSLHFDDGTPITSMSDIMANLAPGPMMEMALKIFVLNEAKAQTKEVQAQAPVGAPKSKEQDAVDALKAKLESDTQAADVAEEKSEQQLPGESEPEQEE